MPAADHHRGSDVPITPRPALFRALGRSEPPPEVVMQGRPWRRTAILKHDSWAATAAYADDSGRRAAIKFNRVQSLLGVPMSWVGERLARREQRVLDLMQGAEGFPQRLGPVSAGGRVLPNAVAHEWIDGRTFTPWETVNDEFFPRLRDMVAALHRRDIAHVDLAKWQNILIGDDGRPYRIDYQIHWQLSSRWPARWWLRCLQQADIYHLYRHWLRVRPDQFRPEARDLSRYRPDIIRAAEALGRPLRSLRLLALRAFGVRIPQQAFRAIPEPGRAP